MSIPKKKKNGKIKSARVTGVYRDKSEKDKKADETMLIRGKSSKTGKDTTFTLREDSARARLKRHYEDIIRRAKKNLGTPATQKSKPKPKPIKGGKAKTSLTKRHNKQK